MKMLDSACATIQNNLDHKVYSKHPYTDPDLFIGVTAHFYNQADDVLLTRTLREPMKSVREVGLNSFIQLQCLDMANECQYPKVSSSVTIEHGDSVLDYILIYN